MNAILRAGLTYYVEKDGALVVGGTFAEDTTVKAINVIGKAYHVYELNGETIFVKASEDL